MGKNTLRTAITRISEMLQMFQTALLGAAPQEAQGTPLREFRKAQAPYRRVSVHGDPVYRTSCRKAFVLACATLLAFALLVPLTACNSSGGGGTSQAAATVNGVEIPEQVVTDYIQNNRRIAGLEDEEAWAGWMIRNDLTPESYRESVLNDLYISQELTKQLAEKEGIDVKDQADEQFKNTKESYSSEENWTRALEEGGYTEDSFLAFLTNRLYSEQLTSKLGASEAISSVTDEEALEYLKTHIVEFDGAKRSSQILFDKDSLDAAGEVLSRIRSEEISFTDAVQEYSIDEASKAADGDMGWDKTNLQLDSAYTSALKNMDVDQMSDAPIPVADGHAIVLCTEVYTAPEGMTTLEGVPEPFVAAAKSALAEDDTQTSYTAWFAKQKEEADIVINPMPTDVPYNVDLSAYQEASEEDPPAEGTPEEEVSGDAGSEGGAEGDGSQPAEGDGAGTDEGDASGTDGSADGGEDPAADDEGAGAADGANEEAPPAEGDGAGTEAG